MSSPRRVPRALSVLAAVALCLFGSGCPVTDPEPIAGSGGSSGDGGSGGKAGSSGVGGTTATGGVSGFVGDTGGGPSIGTEDGSSGITGRQ